MPITRKKTRKMQNNNKDINGRCRNINNLPDHVLSKIVSFLPIKDAVRTSILSQRWKFVWTTIPELCFVQGDTDQTMKFMNFIKRALALREFSKITKFELYGRMCSSLSVQPLITSVALCNVEEFRLHLSHIQEALSLPISLLNCSKLTDLHLRMRGQKINLHFLINLPSLKLLKLWSINFPNQHSAQNLFFGCPVLENLQMLNCNWSNVKTVRVSSSKLRKLNITVGYHGRQQNEQNDGIEFVIQGSGITHIHHFGFLYMDYCIVNPTLLLKEVTINLMDFTMHRIINSVNMANRLLRLLRSVSHGPKLKLGLYTATHLLGIPEVVIAPMPMGLKVLEQNKKSSDFSNRRLLKILENTLCVEALIFREGITALSNPIEDGILNPVPPCFLNRLKYVFVHVLYGLPSDLKGIKILLKNAKVLRRMDIMLRLFVIPEMSNKFPLELLKIPRASKDCGIYII